MFIQLYIKRSALEEKAEDDVYKWSLQSVIHEKSVKKYRTELIDEESVDWTVRLKELQYETKTKFWTNEALGDYPKFLNSVKEESVNIQSNRIFRSAFLNFPKKQKVSRLSIKPNENGKNDMKIDSEEASTKIKTKLKIIRLLSYVKYNNAKDTNIILKTLNDENSEIFNAKQQKNLKIRIKNKSCDVSKEELFSFFFFSFFF